MKEKNYLLSVLGISAIPRVLTSLLTLITFPLLIRSLGSSNYGIVIYVGVIVSALESMVDFGISSAAGKSIAKFRELNYLFVRNLINKWAYLQFKSALIGLLPLLFLTLLFTRNFKNGIEADLIIFLVLSTWILICLNFIKAVLSSLLEFKFLAIVDSFESISRSLSWLIVSFLYPTAIGLAFAQLITAFLVSLFSIVALKTALNYKSKIVSEKIQVLDNISIPEQRNMLKESLSFLWLRLITRIFQGLPMFLFGKIYGPGIVGIIGSFSKVVEICNFPFSVMGNALAVKAHSIISKGELAVRKLWDTVLKILLLALFIALSVNILSLEISNNLLPGDKTAIKIIPILSCLIVSNIISSIIAPMSDYIGSLNYRNLLMTIFTFIQSVSICLSGLYGNLIISIILYVIITFSMNIGYIKIAINAYHTTSNFKFEAPFIYSLFSIILSFLFVKVLSIFLLYNNSYSTYFFVGIFALLFLFFILMSRRAKKYLLTKSFFDIYEGNNK